MINWVMRYQQFGMNVLINYSILFEIYVFNNFNLTIQTDLIIYRNIINAVLLQ